jgi:hypothetical protein
MPNAQIADTSLPDPRDDEFWTRYLTTCAALGVRPVSIERAREPMSEWLAAIARDTLH